MKIDLDPSNAAVESATRASASSTTPTARRDPSNNPADVSSIQAWAALLAERVHQLPEIRQERVTAIAHAVRRGTYQLSPEKTAEAIFSELHLRDGAAA